MTTALSLVLLIVSTAFASRDDAEERINRNPASGSFSSHICTGRDPKGGEYSYGCDSSGRPTGNSTSLTANDLLGNGPTSVGSNTKAPYESSNSIDAISYISDCRATGASKSECETYLRDAQSSTSAPASPEEILKRSYGYTEASDEPGKGGATGSATCASGEVKDNVGRCVVAPTANRAGQQDGLTGPPASAANQQPTYDLSLCTTAKSVADNDCNPEAQSWMKAINQVSTLLGSQMNQGACSSLAAAQAGSAASMELFTTQCGKAVNHCVTECRKSITSTDPVTQATATEAVKACNAKGVSAKDTEQAAAQGIQKIAQAVQTCKTAFGMDMGSLGSQTAYVGKTADDILAGLQPQQDQGLNYEGTGSALTGDMDANVDLSGLIDDTPAAGVAAKPRGLGQDPGGQQGSAGMGSGGGVGVDANSGKAANRRGSTGLLSNILSGFFGGGGGGLFGGSGRSGTGGGSGGWFGGASGSGTQAATKTPDLRQFLPGAKFDPKKDRGIAGRIVSKDGISGPHSNVWRDISNRYQVKRASLLP